MLVHSGYSSVCFTALLLAFLHYFNGFNNFSFTSHHVMAMASGNYNSRYPQNKIGSLVSKYVSEHKSSEDGHLFEQGKLTLGAVIK